MKKFNKKNSKINKFFNKIFTNKIYHLYSI